MNLAFPSRLRQSVVAAALVLLLPALAWAADPTGTWKWTLTAPQGGSLESTAVFKWDGKELSGAVKNRAGEAPISNAKLEGDQISFSVTRKFRRREMVAKYTGQVKDDAIQGTIETTGRDDKVVKVAWTATRTP